MPEEAATMAKLIETLKAKMDETRADYLRVLDLYSEGKSHLSRLDYQKGVYDRLERAWREAVFAQRDMDRDRSA
jgi:hypothetical protein